MLENGFYWVKPYKNSDELTIAEFDDGYWSFLGNDMEFPTSHLPEMKVGPRIEVPKGIL